MPWHLPESAAASVRPARPGQQIVWKAQQYNVGRIKIAEGGAGVRNVTSRTQREATKRSAGLVGSLSTHIEVHELLREAVVITPALDTAARLLLDEFDGFGVADALPQ